MSLSIHLESTSLQSDAQLEFQRQIHIWRELLARCSRKPGRKVVHRLRVATLRLQAVLEFSASSIDANPSPAKPVERWTRQAKKLRHALGPVRQSDIFLDQLAAMRGWTEHPASAPAVFPKEYVGVIEEIERTVSHRRKSAAKKLTAEIERRGRRLERLSRKLETSAGGFTSKIENGISGEIQLQIAATAAEFAVLNTENLHAFRKRIKKIRYLAEVFASVDASAACQASMLKRMTSAIGEWHDWQALAEEAPTAGRGEAATTAIAEFLRAQACRTFDHTRMLCTSTMAKLLQGAADSRHHGPVPAQTPRKPVISASPVPDGMHAERSADASKLAG